MIAWTAVAAFWFALTANHHPTRGLAVGVTITLVAASAIAAHLNLGLRARKRRDRTTERRVWAVLVPSVLILTAVALAIIRLLYTEAGFTPGSVAYHYAIDLAGIVVHVAATAAVVGFFRALRRERGTR